MLWVKTNEGARTEPFWLIVLGVGWAGFHYRASFSGFKNWALPSKQIVGPFDELKKCAALPPSGTVQSSIFPQPQPLRRR